MKPGPGQFRIEWKNGLPYWPDFVVETDTQKLICEVKARNEMEEEEVQLKKKAAERWCEYATKIAQAAGKKPWRYLLIPHDVLKQNRTLQGLIATYGRTN